MTAKASLSSIRVVSATGQSITGVGKYRYIAMLAEGGMADVYLAVTQSSGFEKLVVIKQLRPSLAEDQSFVDMFMDEARLAARLNHPNVVQTLEVGTDAPTGLHFIAMEFLEGVAHVRFARLKERVPPPLAFHIRILVEALRGLHYAHELCDFDGKPLNVVHRDVSPQNVMLTWAGGVKVLDFGIAKAALAAEKRPEDFKGKLEYMAPEQATRDDVDRRADVFSVGVMLHEALTRRRLFRKGDDKLAMLIEGRLPDVLTVAPSSPKRLAEICAQAMAHDREHRYLTADAMADDLEEWLGSTKQHVSARDVGTWIGEKFASTRAKITAAVEEQLALFRTFEEGPDTMPLARMPFADMAPPDFPDGPSSYRHGRYESIPPPAPVVAPAPVTAARSRVFPVLAIGGLTVLTAALAVETTMLLRRPRSEPAATAPNDAVDLIVRVAPSDARVLLDGVVLAGMEGRQRRDTSKHVLRVEANGYEPVEQPITFERATLVTVNLKPLPVAAEPATSSSTRRPPRTRTR